MNKVIEYYIKNVFGNENIYIKDVNIAYAISVLTKKKTIDSQDMIALENLGFEFKEVLAPRG